MAFSLSKDKFISYFEMTVLRTNYKPDDKYSVFTQYDKEHYIRHKKDFLFKYKCFAAIGSVLRPKHLIELGVCAASGAHAYLFESKQTFYTGYDIFGKTKNDGEDWDPFEIAKSLLKQSGIHFNLHKLDLRSLNALPTADVVVVDADHSYNHAFKDCLLAKTANPDYIFIDDYIGEDVRRAVDEVIKNHIKIDWCHEINYIGKGLLIKILK